MSEIEPRAEFIGGKSNASSEILVEESGGRQELKSKSVDQICMRRLMSM